MAKKLLNINNLIWVSIIVQFLLALLTIHAFAEEKTEIFCIVALIFVLILPYILLKCKGITSLFRFMTMYFAFIPSLNPAILVSLLKQENLFAIEFSLNRSLILLSVLSKELIVVMLLLFVIYAKAGLKTKKWQIALIISTIFLCVGMFLFPALSEVLLYMMTYLLIISAFYYLEKVCNTCHKKYERLIMGVVMSVFYFKGIYQMLAILEITPIM